MSYVPFFLCVFAFPYEVIGKIPFHFRNNPFDSSWKVLTFAMWLINDKVQLLKFISYEKDDVYGNDDGHDYLCQRNEL